MGQERCHSADRAHTHSQTHTGLSACINGAAREAAAPSISLVVHSVEYWLELWKILETTTIILQLVFISYFPACAVI